MSIADKLGLSSFASQIRRIHSYGCAGIHIDREEIVVGRSKGCDVCISYPTCLNRHFCIYVTVFEEGKSEPLTFCGDLNSTNGIYVNGRNIGPGRSVLLFNGDVIEIQRLVKFTFYAAEETEVLDELSEKEQQFFSRSYQLTGRESSSTEFCGRDRGCIFLKSWSAAQVRPCDGAHFPHILRRTQQDHRRE